MDETADLRLIAQRSQEELGRAFAQVANLQVRIQMAAAYLNKVKTDDGVTEDEKVFIEMTLNYLRGG